MATLIEIFGELAKRIPGAAVEPGATEMLVTLALEERKQTVRVVGRRGSRGPYGVLSFISRACQARDAATATKAVRFNFGSELGGLALDASESPPVVDVVYNAIAEGMDENEFLAALDRVARLADRIERRMEGADEF